VTALEGSLSAAARKLGQTQPTLSRQVAALEERLGVTLFERVGKKLVLTDTGHDLLEHVRAMGEAAGSVALAATGRAQALVGQVRISAGEIVAGYLLPPIVERIRAEYPEIEVHVVASNRLSDLLRREADIAIRHVRPQQPDLVARKVRDSTAHLYAAKRYLDRHGRPRGRDLSQLEFVGADDDERFVEVLNQHGVRVSVANFKWTTDSHLVGWEMVCHGLGVGGMLREIGEATAGVERVLPSFTIPVPYWVCTHRELFTNRRIRLTFDRLTEAFAGELSHVRRRTLT